MIMIFSVMIFSFGTTLLKKENISSYNSNMITSFDNSITEESGWSLDQLNTSNNSFKTSYNSSVIVTDPEGKDYAYLWGSNHANQLGLGQEGSGIQWVGEPSLVEFDMNNYHIKFLSTNYESAMAVLTDNKSGDDYLYTWGWNGDGELGLNNKKPVYEPTLVTDLPEYDEIKLIDIGDEFTSIVLTNEGIDTLWTTGHNNLGLGDNITNTVVYTEVTFPPEDEDIKEILSINMGKTSTVVATDVNGENILYTWGSNEYYQIDSTGNTDYYNSPVKYAYLPNEYTIKKVISSDTNTMAILVDKDSNDLLYSWGNNNDGQTGVGSDLEVIIEPTLVKFDNIYTEIKDINSSPSTSSAVIIDLDGKEHLYLWGSGENYLFGGTGSGNKNTPWEIKFIASGEYVINEISMSCKYQGMIVDYKGSNQLYMWGEAGTGGLGTGRNNDGHVEIKKITVWDQTPMITFDKGAPSVINDNISGRVLSFTLDWNESSVTPTKIELIDSKGMVIDEASFNKIESGVETKINIENIAPDGIDNVRLKVSDDNKTLVISQLFNIPESFLNKFDAPIEIDYNWMTAQKQLSFTLNYSSYNPLEFIAVYDNKTNEPVNIIIDYKTVINGEKYNIDISDLNNNSEINAHISAYLENGIIIKSEDFIIPATKLKGWVVLSIITMIVLIIISIFIFMFIRYI